MDEFILYYRTSVEETTEWYHRLCNSMDQVINEIKDIRSMLDEHPVQFEIYKKFEVDL